MGNTTRLSIGYDAKRYFLNRTGLGNYSRDLVRMMQQYYPEHQYLLYTPKLPKEIPANLDINQVRLPQGFFNRILKDFWRSKTIAKDLQQEGIQLFHGLSGEIPHGLAEKGIKTVVSIHDLIFLRYPELYKSIDRYIYDKKSSYAVQHADQIIAISEQTKRDIMSFYEVPADKITVIYQGCHPAFKQSFSPAAQQALRQKYQLPEHFLLNVGSIEPRKNALQIVKAIEKMDIPLLIIGKGGAYAEQIRSYVQEKGMENRVFILQGFTMEELACIYSMASIFIYPSKFEGFGIPIIEALYAGTPVITTNSGVFPEAGGPFSYYIDPENTEQLSYAIDSILTNSSMRAEMIAQGRLYAQRFNDENIARQLMACYEKLV